jgi:SAM-dependent methyltransferase
MLDSIDPSNIALAHRYDEIPYDALPHRATHPARLASVATFVGHLAPRPEDCRVLEVGCNDGANLIPMAVSLPGARFVGCDLSPRAIGQGRRTISALGLTNIFLFEGDLAALAFEHGEFDFIVAHGVYSWVAAPVRDALFALAAERLAPAGIMYVSFNVLPGCRVRQAAWDILHHHVDHIDDAQARLDAARRLARLIADGGAATLESDQAVRAELRAIAQRSDSELCHDDLAVPNEPVLFHAFAEHAGRHGLRYLAEAELHTMDLTAASSEAQAFLATLEPGAREQYLDFIRLRRFRQSLLVRQDAAADPREPAQRVRSMHASATFELVQAGAAGGVHKLARKIDPAGGGGGPIRKLLDELVARQPATLEIASLSSRFDLGSLQRPVEDLLADAYRSGIVELHVEPPALTIEPPERPVASPLARLQARAGDRLTTLLHVPVRVADANALKLLPLVDGTRDRDALVAAVGRLALNIESSRAHDFVDYALQKFARLGLLVARDAKSR